MAGAASCTPKLQILDTPSQSTLLYRDQAQRLSCMFRCHSLVGTATRNLVYDLQLTLQRPRLSRCQRPLRTSRSVINTDRLHVGQSRSTQRLVLVQHDDEDALTKAIVDLVSTNGRYRYRRVTTLLREHCWYVKPKRVEGVWRREGLKGQQKRGISTAGRLS